MTIPLERYEELLAQAEKLSAERQLKEIATAFRTWRAELETESPYLNIREHASRTARSLGGMESIGEIAIARSDQELLAVVEALDGICKDMSGK